MEVKPRRVIIYIYKGVTPAGSTQRHYKAGGSGEEEKTGNHGKVGVKKVVGFSSASVFPAGKQEAVTQGE